MFHHIRRTHTCEVDLTPVDFTSGHFALSSAARYKLEIARGERLIGRPVKAEPEDDAKVTLFTL